MHLQHAPATGKTPCTKVFLRFKQILEIIMFDSKNKDFIKKLNVTLVYKNNRNFIS